MTLEDENVRIVFQFFTDLSTAGKSAEERFRLMADDGTWWIPGKSSISGTWNKADRLRTSAEFNRTLCANMVVTPLCDGVTAQGERVAVEATSSALNRVTGQPYSNRYHWLFVVRDGEIKVIKEYMDSLHLQEVFGMTVKTT